MINSFIYSNREKKFSQERLRVGDRIITNNRRLGTVSRIARDQFGEYVVVRIDGLSEEYAYEYTDLEKI